MREYLLKFAEETSLRKGCIFLQVHVILLASHRVVHWISLSTWDLGLEEIHAISDFAPYLIAY